ncbi:MAG: alpha/beta hydrolase [Verrucomicrobiales bacterium]|nr:alpha/beta hydrolase [Verrucomicrobiales bacterium]
MALLADPTDSFAQEKAKGRPAAKGKGTQGQPGRAGTLPAPTHASVPYGPHEKNVLDLWLAKSDKPAPLAVFIHGGGFGAGSKEDLNPRELKELLDAGISVAALNYRLIAQAPLPAAHQDCARALQFIRSKAGEWNLDKTRGGGFGGSAGAQLVMYLAFHDDLADPKSDDPIARESTRLACVAPSDAQMTMDFDWWVQHVPGYDQPMRDPLAPFGAKTKEEALAKNKKIAALELISRDDPPVFLTYVMAPGQPYPDNPQTVRNWKIHHVAHGVELKKLCDRLGVECHLKYPGADTRYASTVEFFKAKLLAASNTKTAASPAPAAAKKAPAGALTRTTSSFTTATFLSPRRPRTRS